MKRALFTILLIFGISILIPSVAHAQTPLAGDPCLENGVATLDCLEPLFANIVYWLMIFSGSVAAILIIIGGIKFLTSGGDQGKVESARKTITYSVIGLVVIISSFMIVNIIADMTGVGCISEFGFDSCEPENPIINYSNCSPGCEWNELCRNTGEDVYVCMFRCGKRFNTQEKGYCADTTRECRESEEGKDDWRCRSIPKD